MSDDEVRLTRWISSATGLTAPADEPLSSWLRSGSVLCALANALQPGSVPVPRSGAGSTSAFALMENIKSFLVWLREGLRLRDADLFVTVDLFEMKNWKQVVHCLLQLAAFARTGLPLYRGPHMEGEIKSAYASAAMANNTGATSAAGQQVAPVVTGPPPAPRKPPPKVPNQHQQQQAASKGAVVPLPASSDSSSTPVTAQMSAAEALGLVAPHARRSSLQQGRGTRGGSVSAAPPSAHGESATHASPSSTGTSSAAASHTGSGDSKLWSTVQSLTTELYNQQSSLRELSLLEQHKSAALGVLQNMVRHQSEVGETVKTEMALLREQMASLQQSNAGATAAAQAAASAAAAAAQAQAQATAQEQARTADATHIAKLQAEISAAHSVSQVCAAASKAQQLEIQQLQQSQAASFAAAAAAAASASASSGSAPGSASASALELESLHQQLQLLRSQQSQAAAQQSAAAASASQEVVELRAQMAAMQAQLAALQSASTASSVSDAAAAAAAAAAAGVTAGAAVSLGESTAAQLAAVEKEFVKTKKQNIALREALLKLHTRVEEGERGQVEARASAMDARATASAAAAQVALWAATPPAVSGEEFANLRKQVLSGAKQAHALEESFEYLSAAFEGAQAATSSREATLLEQAMTKATEVAEATVKARVEEISAAAASAAPNVAPSTPAVPASSSIESVSTAHEERFAAIQADLHRLSQSFAQAQEESQARVAAAASASAVSAPAPSPTLDLDAVRAAVQPSLSSLSSDLSSLRTTIGDLATRVQQHEGSAASPAQQQAQSEAMSSVQAEVSQLGELVREMKEGASSATGSWEQRLAAWEERRKEEARAVQTQVEAVRNEIRSVREELAALSASSSLAPAAAPAPVSHHEDLRPDLASLREQVDQIRAQLAQARTAASGPSTLERSRASSSLAVATPVQARSRSGTATAVEPAAAEPDAVVPTQQARSRAASRAPTHALVPEPVAEPSAEPLPEPVAESVIEPSAEPLPEPVAEPVAEPTADPFAEPIAEPVTEPAAASVQPELPSGSDDVAISRRASRVSSVHDEPVLDATPAPVEEPAATAATAAPVVDSGAGWTQQAVEDEDDEWDDPPPVPARVAVVAAFVADPEVLEMPVATAHDVAASADPDVDATVPETQVEQTAAQTETVTADAPSVARAVAEAVPLAESMPDVEASALAAAAPAPAQEDVLADTVPTTPSVVVVDAVADTTAAAATEGAAPSVRSTLSPPRHSHTHSSSDLLASRYAEEMQRMKAEYEARLVEERRAKEAAESMLQKRRESVSLSAGSFNTLLGGAGGFTPSDASAAGSRLHSARSSVDYGSSGGPLGGGGGSRRASSASVLGLGSLAFSGSFAGGLEGHVVHEGDEEDVDGATAALDTHAAPVGRGRATSSSTNLFALDTASMTNASSSTSGDHPSASPSPPPASLVPASPSMAAYEAQLAAMKADFEARVAAEREITERRKKELSSQRASISGASGPAAAQAAHHSRGAASFSYSSQPSPSASQSASQSQYTPLTIEETNEDPCLAYYAQTVAAGPTEHMRQRMLPIINSSRRCLSLSEVGEGEALRLQANLAIMRETLLGRRRVIQEDAEDSSDDDCDSDDD